MELELLRTFQFDELNLESACPDLCVFVFPVLELLIFLLHLISGNIYQSDNYQSGLLESVVSPIAFNTNTILTNVLEKPSKQINNS